MPKEVKEHHDAHGRLLARAEYSDGLLHGMNQIWNTTGLLIEASEFREGRREGYYRSWWGNGERKEEGMYKGGVRIGRYVWFGEDGSVLKEHDYGPDEIARD